MLPVPNSLYGLCGRKAALKRSFRAQELCESRGGRPGPSCVKDGTNLINLSRSGLPVPNSHYGCNIERELQSSGAV